MTVQYKEHLNKFHIFYDGAKHEQTDSNPEFWQKPRKTTKTACVVWLYSFMCDYLRKIIYSHNRWHHITRSLFLKASEGRGGGFHQRGNNFDNRQGNEF